MAYKQGELFPPEDSKTSTLVPNSIDLREEEPVKAEEEAHKRMVREGQGLAKLVFADGGTRKYRSLRKR